MKLHSILLLIAIPITGSTLADRPASTDNETIKLLVVTGGPDLRHHIDLVPTSFYSLFQGYDKLIWDHATYDEAAFQSEDLLSYDVILFYNRSDSISRSSMERLTSFLEAGKGLIVLHHALGNYNEWEWWWREVVGGKYQMQTANGFEKSGFKQGEKISMETTAQHELTAAIGNVSLLDETYKDLWLSDQIQVLYETNNPTSDGPVVWIGPYTKSRILVIQPGHASSAHENPDYRELLYQGIIWASQ